MKSNLGFCIICGYTSAVRLFNSNHLCPHGHGELGVISFRLVKVFLHKRDSGLERVNSLKKKLPQTYDRLWKDKQRELGLSDKPITKVSKPYGWIKS